MGFAKGAEGNLQLISGLPRMRRGLRGALRHAPLLVGASRKTFLGQATGGCSFCAAVPIHLVPFFAKTHSMPAPSLGLLMLEGIGSLHTTDPMLPDCQLRAVSDVCSFCMHSQST